MTLVSSLLSLGLGLSDTNALLNSLNLKSFSKCASTRHEKELSENAHIIFEKTLEENSNEDYVENIVSNDREESNHTMENVFAHIDRLQFEPG